MTAARDSDAALKDAFQSMAQRSTADCSPEDVERIWHAVGSDLDTEQRRDLIDRMATDPALAQAWRVAHELARARGTESAPTASRSYPRLPAVFMGIAAALILTVGVGLFYVNRTPADTFRSGGGTVVESLVASDAALPRDRFMLRWKPGPAGTRYAVRVTTEDLTVLTTAAELTVPELTVSSEVLASLPSGARVFWQVVMAVPGGDTVSSQTFVARVQ